MNLNQSGTLKLLAGLGLLTLIWLGLLPLISRQPRVAERIRTLEQQGIDPSAIFYTELEAMPQYESSIERIRSRHPQAF